MSRYDRRGAINERYPYSFQQKIILRYLRNFYSGKRRVSALLTYCTICWIVSDFSSEDSPSVNNWPKVISTYSGLGRSTAQEYIRNLAGLGIIIYDRVRNESGRWDRRRIILPAGLPDEVEAWQANNNETVGSLTEDGDNATL